MTQGDRVELRWPGKRGPGELDGPTLPLQVEQRIGGPAGGEFDPRRDLLICADNLLAMQALLATHTGAIDLNYLDPPFATGHDFVRTSFTDAAGEARGELRTHAYHDRWPGGLAGFLRMLEPRLRLAHRLLAAHGSLYLHVDPTVGHYAKLVLDEIFGPGCFQREIVWRIGWLSGFKTRAHNWIRNHDLIFFYTKDPSRFTFNKQYVPHPEGYLRRDGQPARGRGVPMEDVWNANSAEFSLRGRDSLDSIQIKSFSREKTGWATQKNTSLLRRIIAASSRPGDLVADFFCGSGTTLVAAAELGRRFLGCDCALPAIELAHTRLQELGVAGPRALAVPKDSADPTASPAEAPVPTDMSDRAAANPSGAPRRPSTSSDAPVPTDMSEATAGLDRCGLGLGERRVWLGEGGQREHVARLLRHHEAEPLDVADLHGRRGELGVLVGPWDAPLTRAAVHAALARAATLGLVGVDALAWDWAFAADEDLSAGTGLALTCLQLRRDLLDERALARADSGLGERPAFHLEFRAVGPHAVQLHLTGASVRRPERLPADLRAAAGDWRALIEAWSVEFDATAGPLRPDQRSHRTRNQPGLAVASAAHHYPGPGPFTARVMVLDRLGAAHALDFSLCWRGDTLQAVPLDPPPRT